MKPSHEQMLAELYDNCRHLNENNAMLARWVVLSFGLGLVNSVLIVVLFLNG